MAFNTKTKLYIGFFIAAGVLLLTAVASFISTRQLSNRTRWVEHSYQVMQQLKDMELRIKDARSGVRGYLLTADTVYLGLYNKAKGQVSVHLTEVDRLMQDNPQQQLRLDTLQTLVSLQMRLLSDLARGQGRLSRSALQTLVDTDRQTMRAVERMLGRARTRELEILQERSSEQNTYETITPAIILVSAAFAIVITLWLFWRVSVEITANERLQRELTAANEGIAHRISIIENLANQVVQGDYKVKIKDKERDSLGNLATSLNRMTQTLDDTFTALEKRNRELDQFAYVASHDLKAPLRGVSTVVKWIEDELGHELSDKMREYFGLMKGRLSRLEDLINGLLAYARVGRTQQRLEEVNVEHLVHEVTDLVVPPTFELRIEGTLPTLLTDRLSLQQVFTNLLSNAVKYHHSKQGLIRIGCHEAGKQYEFRVQDDGPGIAPEYHEKIFLMFQTLRDRHTAESTGIGLSIVKKIIDEQRGSIRVDSAVGHGAAFVFTWPKQPVGVALSKAEL
ncbi:GHKL domain-containing protein [Hymenobacter oligotrophus]|uniref:histidine kinase n=1 Tax=Hymenobacter oligotrophus TaxID=2319843 RepID=A0A3B7RT21_9BACT|nr:ATP-binding protein [Hymenobacter oligotrophus]AYA37267.1 GHKL domain-containing protein [Hymenobacter oligotrophus]